MSLSLRRKVQGVIGIEMGKKKSWLTYVKRLFISESKTKSEKKWKNSRSLFKFRNYPAIEAPANDAEEQRKRAIAVATAATAAAEAAVAAAAEVARLADLSRELRRKKNLHSAATKIQTCYRGYLARKALNALKGVVRLQAVVRGELARRHVDDLQRSRMVQEISVGTTKLAQLKLRSAMKREGCRRSFSHAKQKSRRAASASASASASSHNSFRAYMATTESAKAKVRSSTTPTPNQRRLSLWESSHSCHDSSPSKLSVSSFNTHLIFNP